MLILLVTAKIYCGSTPCGNQGLTAAISAKDRNTGDERDEDPRDVCPDWLAKSDRIDVYPSRVAGSCLGAHSCPDGSRTALMQCQCSAHAHNLVVRPERKLLSAMFLFVHNEEILLPRRLE